MLTKLVLRNCVQSRARSIFTVLTVAAALLINGLFVSYQARVHGWSAYQPTQKHMAIVSPPAEDWVLPASPLVERAEAIALTDAFLGAEQTKVVLCDESSSLVRPFLSEGGYPGPDECVVPKGLADRLSLSIGSKARLFIPGSQQPLELPIAGLSSDTLWPYVVARCRAENQIWDSDQQGRMLIELAPTSSPAAALASIRRLTDGAEVIPLEDLAESLGLSSEQSLSTAEALQSRLATMILLVAALGVANSLALSLIERSSQIGLLEAIGVSRTRTGLLFLTEALTLSVIGGGVAVAVAAVLSSLRGALVGENLVQYVCRGLPWTTGLGLAGCLILLFLWRFETPLMMLRKRAS